MSCLVCVAGGKGSPGATTLSLALAATSADDEAVTLIDADSDGGDLAAVLGLSTTPGLVSLAAASRHRLDQREVFRHTQTAPSGFEVLCAPAGSDQVVAALTQLGHPFVEQLASSATVADIGRWRPSLWTVGLLELAHLVVLIFHPTVAGVADARWAYDDLARRGRRVVVATRGDKPYGPDEIQAVVGCGPVVAVPDDRSAASMLTGPVNQRWIRRSPLARAATELMTIARDEELVAR